MSGRFMRVKRMIIPTLTLVIIASQLMGCAATNQSELLEMLNQGQQIEIEIATPISEEQGEEKTLDWVQLDQLNTYENFRKQLDDIMKITKFGDNSKNGICYVNLDGQQEGNNTLFNSMMNRKFIANFYENDTANLELQQIINSVYTDVEESEAMIAAINAYWNLLPDATPNYFNGGSTLTRIEAMTLLARASTPVTDTIGDTAFEAQVGNAQYSEFASLVANDSYLDISSKSLDDKTAVGTITRGEYIYMLISNVFGADRISSADIKKASFNDVRNGGDIAAEQQFTGHDMFRSYELRYAMDNPDNGCPERMYQALAAAQELGVISSETRWDEGLTKAEAIQLYLDTLQAYTKVNGYPVDSTGGTLKPVTEINGYQVSQDEGEASEEFTLTEMDIQMVANTEAYTYENPTNDSTRVGVVQKDEVVHVVGQVDGTNWFRIEQGDGIEDDIIASFIDGEFLSEYTEPEEETPAESTQPETPAETQQPSGNSTQPSGGGNQPSGGQPSGGQPSGGDSQPPADTPPAQQPSGDDGPPPGVNVGDVISENELGGNDMTYGGSFDTF